MKIRFIILYCLVFGFLKAFSQPVQSLFLNENRYTIEQGLPDNWVKDMVIDADGFLWLATVNGISRFDSYNFINFNFNSDFSLKNHNITSICSNNLEILASSDSGIEIIHSRNYKRKFIRIDKKQGRIYKMLCNLKGEIFIFQTEGYLSKYVNGKLKANIRIPRQWFRYMMFDDNGDIVVAFNSGKIKVIDSKNLVILEQFRLNVYQSEIFNVFTLKNRKIVMMADSSYYEWSGKDKSLKKYEAKFISNPIVVEADSNFIYYSIDNNSRIVKYNTVSKLQSIYQFNMRNRRISKILIDKNGNIIVSTNQGLFILNPIIIKPYILQDNLSIKSDVKVRRAILKHSDSIIYMLNYEYIEKYNIKSNVCNILRTSKPSIVAYCGLILKDNLWIGLDGGGIGRYNISTQKYDFYTENKDSVVFLRVNHIDSFSDEKLILSSDNGIQLFDTKTKKVIKVIDAKSFYTYSLKNNDSQYLFASNSNIFIANSNLRIKDTITLSYLQNNKVVKPNIYQILKDKIDTDLIWVATDLGLFKINTNTKKRLNVILFSNDIGGNKITHLLSDQYNRLWVSTYNGIYCYHPKQNSILSFKISSISDKNNNMLSDEYNFKSGLFVNNYKIIFGGLTHYLVINPEDVKFEPKIDELYFAKVTVSGINLEKFNTQNKYLKARIKMESNHLGIQFSINNYKNSSEFQYYYKINNYGEWINIGNKPFLNLFNLDEGKHKIFIKAKNSNGIFSKNILILEYYLPQVFYRTVGFYLLCLLLIILIILLYVRQRSMYLKELIQVKQQISYDMHDELGSILTGTSMLAQLVEKTYPEEKNIKIISRNLRTAIRSMKDMIWSVDNSAISIFNLVDRISELVNQTMENKAIELKFKYSIENQDLSLNAYQKRNFISTTKEVLNNVLKHSDATLCELEFIQRGKEIAYNISDNGKGFLTELSYSGVGLQSIRDRIKSIDGTLDIVSNSKGTQIKILVKL